MSRTRKEIEVVSMFHFIELNVWWYTQETSLVQANQARSIRHLYLYLLIHIPFFYTYSTLHLGRLTHMALSTGSLVL